MNKSLENKQLENQACHFQYIAACRILCFPYEYMQVVLLNSPIFIQQCDISDPLGLPSTLSSLFTSSILQSPFYAAIWQWRWWHLHAWSNANPFLYWEREGPFLVYRARQREKRGGSFDWIFLCFQLDLLFYSLTLFGGDIPLSHFHMRSSQKTIYINKTSPAGLNEWGC